MRRYLGLDVHKHYIHGYWFHPGQKGAHCRFPNTPEGWQQLAAHVTPDTAIALEATGNAFQLYDLLVTRAGQVAVAPPLLLKRFGSGRHTDRVDAERLAKMLALGTLPTVWVPPVEVRAIRALLQQVEACSRMARAWQNRAKSALLRAGWAVPAREPVTTWLAAQGAVDEPTRILVTSALTLAEHATAEADRLRGEVLRRVLAVNCATGRTGESRIAGGIFATVGANATAVRNVRQAPLSPVVRLISGHLAAPRDRRILM